MGTIDGVNTAFTMAQTIVGLSVISLNGQLFFEGTHYTVSGLDITYLTAPAEDLSGTVHKIIPVGGLVPSSAGTNLLPYALTTLERVKDRIFDTNSSPTQPTAFDEVLTRMINGATDWFERECGNRRFVATTYTNEIYSAYGYRQQKVVLRQAPITFLNVTGDITLGSPTVASISSTTAMIVGMPVQGDGIPVGTTVSAIGTTTITLSNNATATTASNNLQANGLTKFQWRAGTPSNPSWMDFLIDQYQVVNDGKAGIIRLYGFVPMTQDNMIRVSYQSGYAVDWTNAGNGTTHQLPADISDTVENLVVRKFKRRILAGKTSEGLEGATTSWNKELDIEDTATIEHYRRMSTIF